MHVFCLYLNNVAVVGVEIGTEARTEEGVSQL